MSANANLHTVATWQSDTVLVPDFLNALIVVLSFKIPGVMEDLPKVIHKTMTYGGSVVLVLILVGITPQLEVAGQSLAPDNLVSTAKIIVKSCYYPGVHSEKLAWQFFACYDWAPGKPLFVRCQKRVFNGRLFNSVQNFKKNCQQPLQIPKYASCLMREFRKAGLDMNVAVRKLNACQLPLLTRK